MWLQGFFLELLGGFEVAYTNVGLWQARFFVAVCIVFIAILCQFVPLRPDSNFCLKGKNKGKLLLMVTIHFGNTAELKNRLKPTPFIRGP